MSAAWGIKIVAGAVCGMTDRVWVVGFFFFYRSRGTRDDPVLYIRACPNQGVQESIANKGEREGGKFDRAKRATELIKRTVRKDGEKKKPATVVEMPWCVKEKQLARVVCKMAASPERPVRITYPSLPSSFTVLKKGGCGEANGSWPIPMICRWRALNLEWQGLNTQHHATKESCEKMSSRLPRFWRHFFHLYIASPPVLSLIKTHGIGSLS
jgi:hypothetical protein